MALEQPRAIDLFGADSPRILAEKMDAYNRFSTRAGKTEIVNYG